jgi:ABC-type transport system involved in multi-copper enzyme maturation permease subunit
VTQLVSALMGWLWLRDNGISFASYDVARTIVKACVYTLLFTWAATAFTALVRQQTAALVLMFLWPLAIENILTALANVVPGLDDLAPLTRFLPYNAGNRLLGVRDVTGPLFGDPLTPWGGFLVLAGFAAALTAGSLVLFLRRDA